MESLLAADASAGSFLESAALAHPGHAEAIAAAARASLALAAGRRVGPYRIVRELGHGGMGVVYLAERADAAFEKRTAIKVVRGGFPSELILRRFRDERRILATLEHPNIATLLDGGTTDEGLPYVVMEYVDGLPIDVYCETSRLSLGQRLQLFRQVCAAVQFAHQRLVIHRDIKARNVLVTADGTPKLLDFGIAKLLEPGSVPEAQTRVELRAFSLDGASPEQLRGEPMTVTSDVYALGVLLYELVTGRRPYAGTPGSDADLMRAICDDPPMRPRTAAREGTRFDVRDELEWVVLKALRKEPDRRYGSVEQLADDVGRLLDGRPVLAGPDSHRYRARKFVVRHRRLAVAGVLLTLSLLIGVTTTLWQARRAERQRALAEQRFQNARRVASSMIFELHDALHVVPGATAARALLLTRASEQLDALALEAPDDPVLLEELAAAYHRLGDVQGAEGNANLGDRPAARANHRKGLALRRKIVDRFPSDLEAKSRLVASLMDAAYAEDQVGPSLENAEAAVATALFLRNARPEEMRFRLLLATAHYTLGSQYRGIGDTPRAQASFESATPLLQAVYDANPGDGEARRLLALCHKRLGAILSERKPADAVNHLRVAVALDEASLAGSPKAPRQRRDLSTSNIELGFSLLRSGDPRAGLTAYRRALAIRQDLMRDDPNDVQAPRDVASALWSIGSAYNTIGNWTDAIASFESARPLVKVLMSDRDDLPARIDTGLADSSEGLGRLNDALRLRRQALERHQALLRASAEDQNAPSRGSAERTRARRHARTACRSATRCGRASAMVAGGLSRVRGGSAGQRDLESDGQFEPADAELREQLRSGLARCEQYLNRGASR